MSNTKWDDPEFPFSATEEADGSLAFEWDEWHPVTSVFNDWSEDDFINMLSDACSDILRQNEDIVDDV
jgi:hypothetical protein